MIYIIHLLREMTLSDIRSKQFDHKPQIASLQESLVNIMYCVCCLASTIC